MNLPDSLAWLIPLICLVGFLIDPSKRGARAVWEARREARWRRWLAKKDAPLPPETDWAKYEDFVNDELQLDGDVSLSAFEKEQEERRLKKQVMAAAQNSGLPAPAKQLTWPGDEEYHLDQHREPIIRASASIRGPKDSRCPTDEKGKHEFVGAIGGSGEIRFYVCRWCGESLTPDGRRLAPPSRPVRRFR